MIKTPEALSLRDSCGVHEVGKLEGYDAGWPSKPVHFQ